MKGGAYLAYHAFRQLSNTVLSPHLGYVSAENYGMSPLIASRTAISTWEQFDRIDLGGGRIALKSHANGNYVTAPNGGNSPLIASSSSIGTAETFDLIRNADNSVALRAAASQRFHRQVMGSLFRPAQLRRRRGGAA